MEGNIEDLPDEIMEDLKQKAIERTGDDSDNIENNIDEELKEVEDSPNPPVVEEQPPKKQQKPKRQRSEKQKAAFEKARAKRAENIARKKAEKEANKKPIGRPKKPKPKPEPESSSSEEEEFIYKKKPKKVKKKKGLVTKYYIII